jgi:hypothetical protein
MITNTGKGILAKYLVGQAPAYASYIAVGCGPKPLSLLSCDIVKTSITGNIATITTGQPHGFNFKQKIVISNPSKGNIDPVYLGSYTILSVPTTTTFTYALTNTNLTEEVIFPVGTVSVDFSKQTSLDFEMFRVPISSRGYVVEDVLVGEEVVQVSKIVLTAELPTEERYDISEIGIYSAASNPSAGSKDSKVVNSFRDTELWEYHTVSPALAKEIPFIPQPLDSNNDNIITGEYVVDGVLTETPVFQTNADNRIFSTANRVERYENCRFLNNMVMMRGDTATLSLDAEGNLSASEDSNHIHLTGVSLNFDQNSALDELRLAFSLINVSGNGTPDQVRVLFEFASTDVSNSGVWAKFSAVISDSDYDFATNRYFVSTKQLQELEKSAAFAWTSVNVVKIYVTVVDDISAPVLVGSSDYYVALDALRLENVTSSNSVYGMTGYTIIKTENAETITKLSNTKNYVEFRFGVDVL